MARSTRAVWYELQGRYEFNSKSCDNEETVILAPFKRARVEPERPSDFPRPFSITPAHYSDGNPDPSQLYLVQYAQTT